MYSKPQPGDYPAYYEKYFAQLPAIPVPQLLEQQATELLQLVLDLSEEQAERTYAVEKWNAKQVLGHLMDTERIMLYRALCISRKEKQVLPGFDENAYAQAGMFTKRTLASLVQEYQVVRASSLAFFQHLDKEAFQLRGWVNHAPMTVNALQTIIVAHERHHFNLLKERYLPIWI